MKTSKIKRYRMPISRTFPKNHQRAGQPTYFVEKILYSLWRNDKINFSDIQNLNIKDFDYEFFNTCEPPKLHTCRANLKLWENRIYEVKVGRAVIELYYWSGKPYNLDENGVGQVVFATLDKDSGCGIQELDFLNSNFSDPVVMESKNPHVTRENLAKNDGLLLEDFQSWFNGYDLSKPMGIIQFTKFRY